MRIGIGLPSAVPGTPADATGRWAAAAEERGFRSVSVIDRLVYDNLDPLIALAAAAVCTERVELLTTVLNIGYRRDAVVLAKQIASVELLSGGRLTVGVALGGWPEDYAAGEVSLRGRGAAMESTLTTMRQVWAGEYSGASGPMPALPQGRPGLLLGGLVPAAHKRVATRAQGWVAPSFGWATLTEGADAIRREWRAASREGEPRVVVERYFCLGKDAEDDADHYLAHYYGPEYLPSVRADTLTTGQQVHDELGRLSAAGCDDVILFPCTGALEQLTGLADILDDMGAVHPDGYTFTPPADHPGDTRRNDR
ncbi:LLM class flavin-dependent oxidoreductase [Streptomyces sp. SID3343]|uniref:LLM class flavin-dependent oxidoreductase n=1 Tax=Streptomyces sp. SID3343 TaxID=2690260 RepID=UPI00136D0956|nr:LLM class flavin-dependent oxidoreductase [Streptomyces sp. SID3343]MYW05569.1 LLM class flavin-dependent oxidoreductase [Streptomyces sp. SID3343]